MGGPKAKQEVSRPGHSPSDQREEKDPRESVADTEGERESLLERVSDWLDLPLAFLALIWTVLVVAEFALSLPPGISERIYQVDFGIWLIFAVVFIAEFALAPRKPVYLRRNFLSALSIVLPFVRVVRIGRLARVLRSASLVRLVLVANRATRAAAEIFSQHRFQYVLSLIVVSTLMAAAGVYFFERDVPNTRFYSFGEALWWAATMVTTVNVGAEPQTVEGRVIGILLRIIGLAVFGYVTASIASFLIGERTAEREQPRAQMEAEQKEAIAHLAEEVERLRTAVEQANPTTQTDPRLPELPRDRAA